MVVQGQLQPHMHVVHVVHLGQGLGDPSTEPCRARVARDVVHVLHVAHHTLNLALHGGARSVAMPMHTAQPAPSLTTPADLHTRESAPHP